MDLTSFHRNNSFTNSKIPVPYFSEHKQTVFTVYTENKRSRTKHGNGWIGFLGGSGTSSRSGNHDENNVFSAEGGERGRDNSPLK